MNSKTCFHLAHYAHIISGSALNTHSNDFICTYIECVMSRKRKNCFVSHCEGESSTAGEGRVVGVPWGKCTMAITNINSDWMSNASSGLCINLFILIILFTRVLPKKFFSLMLIQQFCPQSLKLLN